MPEMSGSEMPEKQVKSATLRSRVRIPMRSLGRSSRLEVDIATFAGLLDSAEHVALLFDQQCDIPTVRLHSECLTGDVFESERCDCGPQLREAIAMMHTIGGIILYLRQEGRGIGLYNKLDAYLLQDTGLDTFAANRVLNFRDDQRDYRVAAQMLMALDVRRIQLLSNNPDKATQLRRNGIDVVELLPTGVFATEANRRYLQSKVEIAGHLFRDVEDFT